MTLVVLGDAATDATAVRLTLLANGAGHAVRLISPAEIALATPWVHRVTGRAVSTVLTLRDGTTINSAAIVGLFNRMWALPVSPLTPFRDDDRAYVQSEFHALAVSWLAGLRCPVMNPATPHALCGSPISAAGWHVLAHRAGLRPMATRFTTSQRRFPAPGMVRVRTEWSGATGDNKPPALLAIGTATLGEPVGTRAGSMLVVANAVWPEEIERTEAASLAEPCMRLARAARLSLVRVRFVSSVDERAWLFVAAEPTPDVMGTAQLHAILNALTGRETQGVSQARFADA